MTTPTPFATFSRSATITVGTRQIKNVGQKTGLRCRFEVKATLKASEPNTCDLKIWNLSADTRSEVEAVAQEATQITAPPGGSKKIVPVQIVAGYEGHTSTIFLGELRDAQAVRDGSEIVLELTTGDGQDAIVLSRINKGLQRGSTATAAIQAILTAMKVGSGNLQTSAIQSALSGSTIYQRGALLRGNAMDVLSDLCASVGLEVSVQGGVAQFLVQGQPLAGQAYSLSSASGMIETPSVDTKGVLNAKSLMLPGLKAGGPIVMDAESVKGLFRITSLETVGDTHGQEWECRIEGKRYGLAP